LGHPCCFHQSPSMSETRTMAIDKTTSSVC
jgi:hypothetical protein